MVAIACSVELFVVNPNSDISKLFLFINFNILFFNNFINIFKNILRRDEGQKSPSCLGAAVLGIGTT